MTDREVVAAAIVDDLARPRRLLAARRSRPPELAGRWELPGGKVDPGESAADALRREITEELGVEIGLGAELRPTDGRPWLIKPGWRLRVWLAVLALGIPAAGDSHDQLRWLTGAELDQVDWLDPDRPAIDQTRRLLSRP